MKLSFLLFMNEDQLIYRLLLERFINPNCKTRRCKFLIYYIYNPLRYIYRNVF